MISSTSSRLPCVHALSTLRPRTSLKSCIRPYYVQPLPRTGLAQRTDLSTHSSSSRCHSAASTTIEGPTEETTTTLPSHWVDHLAQLRPGERRALTRYIPLVSQVSALESMMQQLSDDQLAAYTQQFRARLASGESLQSLLPEAFAVVREAASRVLGMRHYDVQILGGIVLAQGQVAEMATGEGKTLVAALPAYLYALSGKGVHIVTVNDYLAQRDASWIGKSLIFLGLSVGVVSSQASDFQRKEGFAADVTYVTAYELAFTFLSDNLAPTTDAVSLRRPLHYAIVDEVDSILIDEARNPFIITVPDDSDTATLAERYWQISIQIAQLLEGPTSDQLSEDWTETGGAPSEPLPFDFLPDYRTRIATLTQRGMVRAVRALAMPEIDQIMLVRDLDNGDLYVVLMAPANDGRLELTIRAAAGEVGAVAGSGADSLDGRRVVVDTREEVESVLLNQFNLHTLSSSSSSSSSAITEEQWRAAAPAALWTGGDHAWGRYLNQAIRAQHLHSKDIHYIVKDGEVVIIDTATGRERPRSRWQAGLHQAIEAKEASLGAKIKSEHYDKGRTTYQSLFNLYSKLCGMTGTAVTEAEEFSEAYNVSVVRVPPHRPSKRRDNPPAVYMGTQGWAKRIIEIVRAAAAEKRPVLMGTSSVEESEVVLNLVQNIPFQAVLTDTDVNRLEKSLSILPNALPPPDFPFSDDDDDAEREDKLSKMTLEERLALNNYIELMEEYEAALFLTKRLHRSRRLTPEIGVAIERGARIFVFMSKAWDLLFPEEMVECVEVADVLFQVVNRSRLGKLVPINLLNARPDRARKEAQIIAQAGLPGTITVATAMAGRGTDILLGGNPKGLTLIALQYYLLPVLAKNADDLVDTLPAVPPLHGLDLGIAFLSEADMKLHLPVPLYKVFAQGKEAAMEAFHKLTTSGGSGGGAGAGAAEAELLPGYGTVTTDTNATTLPTAQDVSEILSKLLEAVEVDRSVFLLTLRRNNQTPSLEAAFEFTMNEQHYQMNNEHGTKIAPTERALRRYALLQWLWFDEQCEKYAAVVRAAGGLATVITSIQDTRRTERQLRGRAGRQGDPGETFMISHRNDPAVQSILSPAQMQGLWAAVEANSRPDDLVEPALMRVVLKTLTTTAEQQGLSARELTRKYDAAIDPYRRHVFRLRRTLAGGGDAARGMLAHRQLRKLVAELVLVYTENGRKHPKYWNVEELLESIQQLFQKNELVEIAGKEKSGRENDDGAAALEDDAGDDAALEAMQISTGSVQNKDSQFELGFQVELNVGSSAAALKDALSRNVDLPRPQFITRSTSSSTSFSESVDEEENAWMPVRRRVAFQNARAYQIETQKSRKAPQEQQIEGDDGDDARSVLLFKGRYAPAVARLQLYMGDLVTILYEKKRRALVTSVYQRLSSTNATNKNINGGSGGGGLTAATPLHVLSMLRLWERDAMLHCIDSLWTDFLQDISTLQRAAMTRSFSQFDPVDEFKLEAAVVFARLLRDFRRQSPVALLAPVDIRHLQWDTTYNAEQQQQQEEQQQDLAQGDGSGDGNNNFDGVLDDVAWLADTMEVEPTTENVENLEKEQPVPAAPAVSQQSTASFGASSAGEGAAIEKLLARISQASSEELGAAIEKLEEKWKNKEKED